MSYNPNCYLYLLETKNASGEIIDLIELGKEQIKDIIFTNECEANENLLYQIGQAKYLNDTKELNELISFAKNAAKESFAYYERYYENFPHRRP